MIAWPPDILEHSITPEEYAEQNPDMWGERPSTRKEGEEWPPRKGCEEWRFCVLSHAFRSYQWISDRYFADLAYAAWPIHFKEHGPEFAARVRSAVLKVYPEYEDVERETDEYKHAILLEVVSGRLLPSVFIELAKSKD